MEWKFWPKDPPETAQSRRRRTVHGDPNHRRFAELLRGSDPGILLITDEELEAVQLTREVAAGRSGWLWSSVQGVRSLEVEEVETKLGTENAAAALVHLAHVLTPWSICVLLDLSAFLDDARTLRALRELLHRCEELSSKVVLIDHIDRYPASVQNLCAPLVLQLPDSEALMRLVKRVLRELNKINEVSIKLSRRELAAVIKNLRGLSQRQATRILTDLVVEDWCLDESDINRLITRKRQLLQRDGVLEYVESPVGLDSIGGLRGLKRWLKRRHRAVTATDVDRHLESPRGILLLGVQGAGKSFAARAIATAWKRPLLRLDPGTLYDRYVGESERRLREALVQAEAMAPIVLWIDEIEKGFASAASLSTDGGLSRRMFGTLLTWMQEHDAPVFLVATANDIAALPPELLRKGRFDELFFVDLPDGRARREIAEIHLKQRGQDPGAVDLDAIVEVSAGFSGAEIEAAIVSAMHERPAKQEAVDGAMIVDAMRRSPPLSVTMAERIDDLRAWASDRCVPAE